MSNLRVDVLKKVDNSLTIPLENIRTFSNTDLNQNTIAANKTINVPAQYATINAAMNYLRNYTIVPNVTVTVKVADGTYTVTEAINLNHPQGDRINIIGNTTTPANCIFKPAALPISDAFQVSMGHTIGLVDGFTVTSDSKAPLANNFTAFAALSGARMFCGPSIRVNNWYYGIASRDGSFISADYAQVNNAGDVGIWAFCGSTTIANFAQSNNASDTVNGWGFGFQAEYGSTLVATGATASGNNIAGFAALSNSTCRILNTTANSNVGSGYLSRDGGQIECHNSTANNNTRYAQEIITSYGQIVGMGFTATGNVLGFVNNTTYIGSDTGQAKLASTAGPLRIDGSPIYFNTANGNQVTINNSAAATTAQVALSGGTGISYVSAAGTATNADLSLAAKGTGRVMIGAYINTGVPTATGFIEVKDYNGNILEIPVKLRP